MSTQPNEAATQPPNWIAAFVALLSKKLSWPNALVLMVFLILGAVIAAFHEGWIPSWSNNKTAEAPKCIGDVHAAAGSVVNIVVGGSNVALNNPKSELPRISEPKQSDPNSIRPPLTTEDLYSPRPNVPSVAQVAPAPRVASAPQQPKLAGRRDSDPFVGRTIHILPKGSADAYLPQEMFDELCVVYPYPQCFMPHGAGRDIPVRQK